ncbi:MAG: ATP-binding protein [Solibacillus sp.]
MQDIVIVLLVVSIFLNIYLIRNKVVENREIDYVEKKLHKILDNKTDEQILLITSNRQMQLLLIQINQLLEHNQKTGANFHQIERSMRKMLANISHDLKTPLTVILGYTEILLNDKNIKQEKKEALLQTVNLKTFEVLDLIHRFFELVKLESDDHNLEMSKIEIGEICRKKILEYYEILIVKEFDVTIDISEDQIFVWGNTEALERILNNLISNAIKYGFDGQMLGMKVRATDDHVYIEVIDQGQGIHEVDKDRVFERLYTMEDSRNKQNQGSGLGLTITKRLVEQLGGRIHLDSKPFEKTTFRIELKRVHY